MTAITTHLAKVRKAEENLKMGFFEYFDAGYALIIALSTIAALTPTDKDDYVLDRAKNLMNKVRFIFRR